MRTYLFFLFYMPALFLKGQALTHLIRLDQFGYLPDETKVAVISNPEVGFNASESFSPGTVYRLMNTNGQIAWTGAPVAWNNGNLHAQSGDRGWWLDFSAVNVPGDYFLLDVQKNVRSYTFHIGNDVYRDVLKQAVRMFFYQRIGFDKTAAYAGSKWTDGACYLGAQQDTEARSRFAKTDPATARDVRGGWMDAGDVNKYTTFTESVILQLMQAYRANPTVFTDDYGIPESGNGVPDLLDEVKWELDFLARAQDATGTGGVLLKVGVDNYNDVSPPSTDTRPRYYLPECTASDIAAAAMFAAAGVAYRTLPNTTMQAYGDQLISRAENAWQRATVITENFTSFQTNCDDGDIKSGDADRDEATQLGSAVTAAVYLYEATGKQVYKSFVDTRYAVVEPISNSWWGPYRQTVENALLLYSNLPGASSQVANTVRIQKSNCDYIFSVDDFEAEKDLYRAHLEDWAHHWGSNNVRANAGSLNLDFVQHNVNPAGAADYKKVAAAYLHWLHGVNPLGMVMLSNMYGVGGDLCANEIYHTWFANNTEWDNALSSPKGPPPGYVVGGPNASFSYTQLSPPANQPPQKSYLDFNTGWPESSWEITEPAIYYQAAYILLLSRLMPEQTTRAQETLLPDWTLEISPNPAGTHVQIGINLPVATEINFDILDGLGKSVFRRRLNGAAGPNTCRINTASWPNGVYFLHLNNGKSEEVRKVMVQH